jgi:thiol-disulfide isomerase/thioredoxin
MAARHVRSLVLIASAALAVTSTASARQTDGMTALAALARLEASDLDGRRWSLDEFRGRVVLLDFWATWCAPCLADIPKLQALRARYPRHEFEIVGISLDATSRRALTSFLNRNRIDWPQIHQPRGYGSEIARLFRIEQLPVTVVLDRNGFVSGVHLRGDALASRIHELVTAEPPSESSR